VLADEPAQVADCEVLVVYRESLDELQNGRQDVQCLDLAKRALIGDDGLEVDPGDVGRVRSIMWRLAGEPDLGPRGMILVALLLVVPVPLSGAPRDLKGVEAVDLDLVACE
jgi:hypothetical protein